MVQTLDEDADIIPDEVKKTKHKKDAVLVYFFADHNQ
jgi:hypothetical protein